MEEWGPVEYLNHSLRKQPATMVSTMKLKSLSVLLATVGILWQSVVLVDAQQTPVWLKRFRDLDADNNGTLSAEELAGRSGWLKADLNQDGQVTELEARRFLQSKVGAVRAAVSPEAPYRQTEHQLSVDERKRRYVVQWPKRQLSQPLPVVLFFHGGGGTADRVAANGFGRLLKDQDFIAVYPDAWKNNWNDGRQSKTIAAQVEGVDDLKFVRAVIEDVAKRHAIDRTRIFAGGISNGGIFSHFLAANAADMIAGIAPVIGGLAEPLAPTFKPSRPISLFVIQGDADRLVPFAGGGILGRDRRGRVLATEQMLGMYLRHNGIAGKPVKDLLSDVDPNDGTTTERLVYPAGRDGVKVQYYRIRNGGHRMPGIAQSRERESITGKVSMDFNGYEVIWDFFESCPPRKP